jgi:hypothetical protein
MDGMSVPDRPAVRVRIHWRDTVTGREGVYEDPPGRPGSCTRDEDGKLNAFWWEDGNGACDCNRASLFAGIEYHECGDGRFEIVKIEEV